MWKKIILLIIYLLICILIYQKYTNQESINIITSLKEKVSTPIIKEKPIGHLIIPKLNLNEELYSKNSPNNNIEKHVTILSPSQNPEKNNTTIFIAAHSGTGKIAYFKNLNKLVINDQIHLLYNNKQYTYFIKNIWETKKTGTIYIPKENTNQLILTTCSPQKDGYQLIVNAHIKRTNSD